ncbi:AraC family transcriptional regulator [Streptomyces tsukubensis]|uniref:AraC family transcriptional regulator n=1 Tax=Streptomyces tsukubensis TaxID=83656 RepID=UPI0036B92D3C
MDTGSGATMDVTAGDGAGPDGAGAVRTDAISADVMAELLDGVRARGAVFRCACVDGPWSLRFAGGAPLTLVAMVRGTAWIVPDAGEPVPLAAGDVAVVRGRAAYTVADDPGAGPRTLITGAAYCPPSAGGDGVEILVGTGHDRSAEAAAPASCEDPRDPRETAAPRPPRPSDPPCGDEALPGDAPVGNGVPLGVGVGVPSSDAVLLSGAYDAPGSVSDRLLRALPEILVVPGTDFDRPLFDLVTAEIGDPRPGRRTMLDRLLDLMLLAALRAWFDRPGAQAPPWYRAWEHPVAGPALQLMHDAPAHRWTVASLALRTGVSRAALARHFTEQVGEPPMTYLTAWRVGTAADLLLGTDDTVDAIARRVGYANAFALSVAFKRLRGISPTEHRSRRPVPAA